MNNIIAFRGKAAAPALAEVRATALRIEAPKNARPMPRPALVAVWRPTPSADGRNAAGSPG